MSDDPKPNFSCPQCGLKFLNLSNLGREPDTSAELLDLMGVLARRLLDTDVFTTDDFDDPPLQARLDELAGRLFCTWLQQLAALSFGGQT